jgi:RecA-family ATPase
MTAAGGASWMGGLGTVEWRDQTLADWHGRTVPPFLWIVPDWIPRLQVTGLYGISGINKTDFLLQLCIAKAAGWPFLGYTLEPGPVYGLFCEDIDSVIIRRAQRIIDRYNELIANDRALGGQYAQRTLADFTNLHFASLVGVDMTEFVSFDNGEMKDLPALLHFDQHIAEYKAELAVLDTIPDFFGGNEVTRREVSRFIRKLDGVSMTRECAILYTAHPSVRGEKSGMHDSGSTGWGGKTRSRIGMEDPGPPDQEDEDKSQGLKPKVRIPTDRRTLIRLQCNYAIPGVTLDLICHEGFFSLAPSADEQAEQAPERGPERDAAVSKRFIELLAIIEREGRTVNDSVTAGNYAPRVFAEHPYGKLFSKAEYNRAMGRLFANNVIKVVGHGPPSRGWRKIVLAAGDADAQRTNGEDRSADRSWQHREQTQDEREQMAANAARHMAEQEGEDEPLKDEHDNNETQS